MGAWIETQQGLSLHPRWLVAPYVGAWIETKMLYDVALDFTSHPMWVRGLKQQRIAYCFQEVKVAPYVGAWIETSMHHNI